jgi:hypothetical protein
MKPLTPASAAASDGPAQPGAEQRTQPDRRQNPTSPWSALPPAGLRTQNRRAEEHQRPYFVDRFSLTMFIVVLFLIIASLVDAVLTIQLLEAGGDEINPLLNHALSHGVIIFLFVKYILTVGGLPVLLIFKNHYLFRTRVRVGYLLPFAVTLYAVLIGYQLVLMHKYIGL